MLRLVRHSRARLVLATAAGLLAVVGVVGGVAWWRSGPTTELGRAMQLAPADSERFSWTHWAGVRRELGASLSASSSTEELDELLTEGFDADLTSTSALVESAGLLHEEFGWSPATVEWELFTQTTEGAVVTVELSESLDVEDLGDRLEELGYERPDSDDGVWKGDEDLLARIADGARWTPTLQNIAFDADAHLLRASDDPAYLTSVLEGPTGVETMDSVAEASGNALSAALYTGDRACAELAMGHADDVDQQQADELIDRAGEVNPIRAFAMATQPSGDVRVAMSFQSEEQARENADSRATLASGAAPGQGGDFAERFRLGEVVADGTLVTMELQPVDGAFVMSDLSTGPVLFATC